MIASVGVEVMPRLPASPVVVATATTRAESSRQAGKPETSTPAACGDRASAGRARSRRRSRRPGWRRPSARSPSSGPGRSRRRADGRDLRLVVRRAAAEDREVVVDDPQRARHDVVGRRGRARPSSEWRAQIGHWKSSVDLERDGGVGAADRRAVEQRRRVLDARILERAGRLAAQLAHRDDADEHDAGEDRADRQDRPRGERRGGRRPTSVPAARRGRRRSGRGASAARRSRRDVAGLGLLAAQGGLLGDGRRGSRGESMRPRRAIAPRGPFGPIRGTLRPAAL